MCGGAERRERDTSNLASRRRTGSCRSESSDSRCACGGCRARAVLPPSAGRARRRNAHAAGSSPMQLPRCKWCPVPFLRGHHRPVLVRARKASQGLLRASPGRLCGWAPGARHSVLPALSGDQVPLDRTPAEGAAAGVDGHGLFVSGAAARRMAAEGGALPRGAAPSIPGGQGRDVPADGITLAGCSHGPAGAK